MNITELIGALVGIVLSLMIFSYLLGDNALFRLAIHIFIGVAAAYAVLFAWYSVLWPQLLRPLLMWDHNPANLVLLLFPVLLSVLLLFKLTGRWSGVGSPVMAYLAGIGAAVAIGGAVFGTIYPQANASVDLFSRASLQSGEPTVSNSWYQWINAGIILIGTLTTLAFFHFNAKPDTAQASVRPAWLEFFAQAGQFFIAITFGVIFAGIYLAAMVAMVERTGAFYTTAKSIINFFASTFIR